MLIRFTRAVRPYRAGETADFDRGRAAFYVQNGVAEHAGVSPTDKSVGRPVAPERDAPAPRRASALPRTSMDIPAPKRGHGAP